MKKIDIVNKLAKANNITKKMAIEIVDDIFAIISDGIATDGRVDVRGFGSFIKTHKEARDYKNPQNGEIVHGSAKNGVKFKVSPCLKDSMNN